MTNPRRARDWDILELDAGDARRIRRESRTIHRIPTLKEQRDAAWRSTDKWTREAVREILRLGFDVACDSGDFSYLDLVVEGHGEMTRVYLTNVGRTRMTLTLCADADEQGGIIIRRVLFGDLSWTARQAALWLRKRSPR
jgi:hypothetical protein